MTETVTRRAFGVFVLSTLSLAFTGTATAGRRTYKPVTITKRVSDLRRGRPRRRAASRKARVEHQDLTVTKQLDAG